VGRGRGRAGGHVLLHALIRRPFQGRWPSDADSRIERPGGPNPPAVDRRASERAHQGVLMAQLAYRFKAGQCGAGAPRGPGSNGCSPGRVGG
jgi:hypothetical protein